MCDVIARLDVSKWALSQFGGYQSKLLKLRAPSNQNCCSFKSKLLKLRERKMPERIMKNDDV